MVQRTLFDPPPAQALPDPCARKHGGNLQSQAAFADVKPTIRQTHADILAAIAEAGPDGLTAKEYLRRRERLDGRKYGLNHFSGRFRELFDAGRIARNGMRRDKAAAWVVVTT